MMKSERHQKPRVKISKIEKEEDDDIVSDSEQTEEELSGSEREDKLNDGSASDDEAMGSENEELDNKTPNSAGDDDDEENEDDDQSETPCSDHDDIESRGEAPAGSNEEETDPENDGSESGNNEDSLLMINEGWADSVAKILGSKKPKNKKTLVLSRAKKHSDVVTAVKEEKPSFEVLGEAKDVKPELKKESNDEPLPKKKKIEKESIRVRPNVLEKDREKILSKIATKGVVQLFNAVRNQQKTLEKQIDRSDMSEVKKEKILKKFDKRTFLDTLMGQTKSVVVDQEAKSKSLKNELKNEETPRWSALRDDFMTGAKLKDWDKESGEEE